MKPLVLIALLAGLVCFAGDRKPLPGQAGNDDIDLEGSLILSREEITDLLGTDLGDGYIVVRMKAIPKTAAPLHVSPDDFSVICRKDGQRSDALSPTEIAGKGAMIIKRGDADGSKNGWSAGGFGAGLGSSPGTVQRDVIKGTQMNDAAKGDPALLKAIAAKSFPEKDSKAPVEGLLFFSVSGKLKPKDISLFYRTESGKLIMDFPPEKKK
jgi:hypothetical protein